MEGFNECWLKKDGKHNLWISLDASNSWKAHCCWVIFQKDMRLPHMEVSWNTTKSFILGISIRIYSILGYPYFGKHPMLHWSHFKQDPWIPAEFFRRRKHPLLGSSGSRPLRDLFQKHPRQPHPFRWKRGFGHPEVEKRSAKGRGPSRFTFSQMPMDPRPCFFFCFHIKWQVNAMRLFVLPSTLNTKVLIHPQIVLKIHVHLGLRTWSSLREPFVGQLFKTHPPKIPQTSGILLMGMPRRSMPTWNHMFVSIQKTK